MSDKKYEFKYINIYDHVVTGFIAVGVIVGLPAAVIMWIAS